MWVMSFINYSWEKLHDFVDAMLPTSKCDGCTYIQTWRNYTAVMPGWHPIVQSLVTAVCNIVSIHGVLSWVHCHNYVQFSLSNSVKLWTLYTWVPGTGSGTVWSKKQYSHVKTFVGEHDCIFSTIRVCIPYLTVGEGQTIIVHASGGDQGKGTTHAHSLLQPEPSLVYWDCSIGWKKKKTGHTQPTQATDSCMYV